MMEIWNRLAPREKLLLKLAGVCLAVAVAVQGFLMPMLAAHREAGEHLSVAEGTLTRMDRLVEDGARYIPPRAETDTLSGQTPQALAAELGLLTASPQPSGDGSLLFQFDGADPAVVFAWLDRVEAESGLEVRSAELRASGQGRVLAKIAFSGATAP